MKRVISYLSLVLSILMLLTACGRGGANAPPTTGTTTAATTQVASTELNIMYLGNPQPDVGLVQDALNKILEPKINVRVKLTGVGAGAYMQQQNLITSSNEKVDLMITFPYTYTSLVAQNKIQEIGPLLDQYGQGVKAALGDYLKGSTINGKIYGVRPISDLAGGGGLVIRKDIVDKYKIDISNISNYEDMGRILKAIKDKEPNSTPMTYPSESVGMVEMQMPFDMDKMSDFFGALMYGQPDLKLINPFESTYYADKVKTMRDWYTKGYIMKDAGTSTEDHRAIVKAGKAYCYISPTKPGLDVQESTTVGLPMYISEYSTPVSATSNITLFQWVVPNGATDAKLSVQMLNEMYTNAAVENLMAWGIEGKHYVKQADGTIGFPAGVDNTNSGYFLNVPWMFGNEFLDYVWTGNPPDIWQKTKEHNEKATISKAMGFTYDPTPVKSEVAALTSTYGQYKRGLESGSVDPAKVLPEMISKLKASGIDKVIAEKQKQFDAWAKENNIS